MSCELDKYPRSDTKEVQNIVVRTNGNTVGNGVLYQIDFDTTGMFAQTIGAPVVPLSQVNAQRTTANDPDCG